MKKVMIIVGMLCIILTGCNSAESVSAEDTIEVEQVKTVEAYGVVQVKDKMNVALNIPGKITKVVAMNGQEVNKGDVLFKMDIDDYKDELVQKKQELEMKHQELKLLVNPNDEEISSKEESISKEVEAKNLELSNLYNQYNSLKTGLADDSDEDIKLAILSMTNLEKMYNDALLHVDKSQNLYDENIISKSELDAAINQSNQAKLEFDTSVVQLSAIKKQKKAEKDSVLVNIKYISSQLNGFESQSELSNVEYELKLLEINMLETQVEKLQDNLNIEYMLEDGSVISHLDKAIFDGFQYVVGDMVAGEISTPIYTMYDTKKLEVYTKVSEDFIKDLYIGQKANIIPVAARDQAFSGEITAIASIAYQEGGEAVIPVWISFEDPSGLMRANYSVDVEFVVK